MKKKLVLVEFLYVKLKLLNILKASLYSSTKVTTYHSNYLQLLKLLLNQIFSHHEIILTLYFLESFTHDSYLMNLIFNNCIIKHHFAVIIQEVHQFSLLERLIQFH